MRDTTLTPWMGKRPGLLLLTLGCLASGAGLEARSGEGAAPSSHFVFDDRFPGDLLIHEVRVPAGGEATYTYYETLGWRGKAAGYAGIQSHPRGRNFIFSIWDSKTHTAPIRAIHQGPGTLVEKFGGEGTGLKSWNFELGWNLDSWITLVARCWPVGEHTFHGFWARKEGEKGSEWTHLVTMDVAAPEAYYEGGTDAFIEDWLETGERVRMIHLRGGWRRSVEDGVWHPFREGRYSVNAWDLEKGKRSFRFRTAWNGGVADDETGSYYFMVAGGKATRPTVENPSGHAIPRTAAAPDHAPLKLLQANMKRGSRGTVTVTWKTDAATLPQFAYTLEIRDKPGRSGEPAVAVSEIDPSAREASLTLPEDWEGRRPYLWLQCRDLLDHEVGIAVKRSE